MRTHTLSIPVKERTLKILTSSVGPSLQLSKETPLSHYTYMLLQRGYIKQVAEPSTHEVYPFDYPVIVKDSEMMKNSVRTVTFYTAQQFNGKVWSMFIANLHCYVEGGLFANPSVQRRDLINNYLEQFGIDEDEAAFEAVKKAEYRLRKKTQNVRNICPL